MLESRCGTCGGQMKCISLAAVYLCPTCRPELFTRVFKPSEQALVDEYDDSNDD
jgi:predicted RNA-binding Zn-ribbon protein involved in translation (DUF1610 family)